MHPANRTFWEHCKEKYPQYFIGDLRLLEVGSYNMNGSLREHFDVREHIGVDWRECDQEKPEGWDPSTWWNLPPGDRRSSYGSVDVVCLAQDMEFAEPFDTVISASMLEHDPYWEQSIKRMTELVKDEGIMILSWGAALNTMHDCETAPDGAFHSLPAQKLIDHLNSLGMYIHEFRYETAFGGGNGEVCLVAFKSEDHANGDQIIDPLIAQDKQ